MIPSPELQAFAAGFPLTLLHAGITILLLIVGAAIYSILSPMKEIAEIREGNPAATISFGGLLLGLAIPLAAALAASPSLLEIVLWGAGVVAVQLLVFRIIDALLAGLPQRVRDGDVSAGVLLTAAKLAAALVLAAAVAG